MSSFSAFAQGITCKVITDDDRFITGTVSLIKDDIKNDYYKQSFFFESTFVVDLGNPATFPLFLVIDAIGYEKIYMRLETGTTKELVFRLKPLVESLEEVNIIADTRPIIESNDTTYFNIAKYRDVSDRTVEDLLKKLPGIKVNPETGAIQFKGKSIQTVLLDNDDLFDTNYAVGTRNINIDDIEGIQAVENFTENPLLKEFVKSNATVLNLKLKKGISIISLTNDSRIGIREDDVLIFPKLILFGASTLNKYFTLGSFNNYGEKQSIPRDNVSKYLYKNANNDSEQLQGVFNFNTSVSGINSAEYVSNKEFFLNHNHFTRVSPKATLRLQAYINDDVMSSQNIIVNEFINEDVTSIIQTQNLFKIAPQLLKTNLLYKQELSKSSNLEIFTILDLRGHNNIAQTRINSEDRLQRYDNTNNRFKQILQLTKVSNERHLFQTYLSYGFDNNNENQMLFDDINQLVSQKAFKFLVQQNYTYKWKNTIWNYELGINNVTYDNINNTISNNQITESKNMLRDYFNTFGLTYTSGIFSAQPKIAISLLEQSVSSQSILTSRVVAVQPSIQIKLRGKSNKSVSLNLSQTVQPFENRYFIKGDYFESILSTNINNVDPIFQKNSVANLQYYYPKLSRQFFFSASLNYTQTDNAIVTDFVFNDNSFETFNIASNSKQSTISQELSLEKYLPFMKSTLNFDSTASISEFPASIDGNMRSTFFSNRIQTAIKLKSAISPKLKWFNEINYEYQRLKSDFSDLPPNHSLIIKSELTWLINTSVQFRTTNRFVNTNIRQPGNSFNLLNAAITYKPEDSGIDFSILVDNMLNQKTANSFIVENVYTQSSVILLNPLTVSTSVRFVF